MKEINREQVVLWAIEAGFPTNYVRGEIARFEKLTRLVQSHVIDRSIEIAKEN